MSNGTVAMNATMNVADFLLASKDPDRVALRLSDADYTYGDLESVSFGIAQFLVSAGGRKGDRAIMLSENSFFWVVAYLGVLRAGMVAVPLPPDISQNDLHYIVQTTGATIALLQSRLAAKYKSALTGILLSTEQIAKDLAAGRGLTDARSIQTKKNTSGIIFPEVSSDDLAAFMFTSGSTGRPRGVMVSHGNIVANTTSIVESLRLRENDIIMTVLPFHYCFGTSLLHTHLRVGGTLVIDLRFMYPEVVLQRMQETECTGFAGVPSHYQILLRSSSLKKKAFPHLRYFQQAGGHLAPSFIRELREALPNIQMFVMYGQTEATARLACLSPESLDSKPGSVGKAIPGVTLRILSELGSEVKPGEIGEIVAEGQNVARGYWNAPEESAVCFRDGRLYTGDLATVDHEGFIYVVDRARDFVKCGGRRVSCRQLEDHLLEFDGILEVAVIGVPDEILGEAVRAFVVPRDSQVNALESQLRLFCKARMSSQLIPREFVILDTLPKNNSGKVLRQQLKSAPVNSIASPRDRVESSAL